ncbi:MAG: amino acid ABC transporter permease [Limnohabitans sp.]|nr:amino acid ABC transporter permease [Limnohabitans sp.]
MNYDWNFSIFEAYKSALLSGLWITLKLTILSSIIGTLLSIPLSFLLRKKPFKYIAIPVNDIFRAIPLLVLIYLFYYFPYQQIFGTKPLPEYYCALLALTFTQAVFTADIIRGAIDGVSNNSILAAQSLGFKQSQIWYYVMLPDIVRQILPTLIAFFIGNLKLSSLASVIAVPEILYVAKSAGSQSFRSLEAWILVCIIYVLLVLPFSYVARKLENSKWLKRRS